MPAKNDICNMSLKIAQELEICVGSGHTVLRIHLQIRKVSARWVPHRLMSDLAVRRLKVVTYLLSSSDSEGHDFFKNCCNGRKVGEVV